MATRSQIQYLENFQAFTRTRDKYSCVYIDIFNSTEKGRGNYGCFFNRVGKKMLVHGFFFSKEQVQ